MVVCIRDCIYLILWSFKISRCFTLLSMIIVFIPVIAISIVMCHFSPCVEISVMSFSYPPSKSIWFSRRELFLHMSEKVYFYIPPYPYQYLFFVSYKRQQVLKCQVLFVVWIQHRRNKQRYCNLCTWNHRFSVDVLHISEKSRLIFVLERGLLHISDINLRCVHQYIAYRGWHDKSHNNCALWLFHKRHIDSRSGHLFCGTLSYLFQNGHWECLRFLHSKDNFKNVRYYGMVQFYSKYTCICW